MLSKFTSWNRWTRVFDVFRPAQRDWSISLFPDGHTFAFTIIHDADSAYSRRLSPLFDVFDEFGLKITVTAFVFWADWAKNGDIWLEWNKTACDDDTFFAPIAVPLVDEEECKFYKHLAARGHEIGMHTPSDTSDTRQDIIRAFEYFAEIFGHYPKVYVEHSGSNNKEAQANEGSDRGSIYYNTDLLNDYGSWVWIDDQCGVADTRYKPFYDILAFNGSPFYTFAAEKYGIAKAFLRTGRWKEGNGDGFLAWYSEANIDALEKNRGLALVYTHLDSKWLDTETRKMRDAIKNRLRYLASKNGWFVSAGKILDRVHAAYKIKLDCNHECLKIVNTGSERFEGLTVISHMGRSLARIGETLKPGRHGEIVLGTIHPGESLWFKIVQP